MVKDDFFSLMQKLKAAGFSAAVGRPRKGQRPLIPELAKRTGMSERHVRRLLKTRSSGTAAAAPVKDSPAHRELRRRLERGLGTKVELLDKAGAGKIIISWHGFEQLEGLLSRMGL